MGRKNPKPYYSGRWACILVVNHDDKTVNRFLLDEKGKLRNKYKSKKHDRTQDYKTYLPDSISDIRFSSSHLLPPQHRVNELEVISQNVSGTINQDSDEMTNSSPISSPQLDDFIDFSSINVPTDEDDFLFNYYPF